MNTATNSPQPALDTGGTPLVTGVSVNVTREMISDSPPGAVDESPQAASETSAAEPSTMTRRDENVYIVNLQCVKGYGWVKLRTASSIAPPHHDQHR